MSNNSYHILIILSILSTKKSTIRLFIQSFAGRIADFITDNRVYLLSFFLPFGILLLSTLISSSLPLGHYSITNGDGSTAEIPAIYDSINLIQHGPVSHFFQSGGGIAASLSNPASLQRILYLLFPEDSYISVVTFLIILRLSLCSFTLVWYLTHRSIKAPANKHDTRLLLAGLIYSLCNYGVILMIYFTWLQALVMLPLILWAMDELMVKKKKRAYIALLSLSFFLHYYMTMFICFYLVLRFFTYRFKSVKEFFTSGVRFTLCSVATGALAFSVLYDALVSLSGSTYGEKDAVFTASYWFESFLYLFQKQSVFTDTMAVSWDEGGGNLYFGLLPLVLIFVFLFSKKFSLSEKLRTLFPIVFLYITFNQSVLNFIFNGLHYQNGVPNRFAFLVPLCCATLSYDALRILPKEPLRNTGISVIIVFLIMCFSDMTVFKESPVSRLSLFGTAGFLIAYGMMILILNRSAKKNALLPQFLLMIAIIEFSANAFYQIYENRGNQYVIAYEQEAVTLLNEKFDFDRNLDKVSIITPLNKNFGSVTKAFTMQFFAGGSITPYQIQMAEYSGMNAEANAMLVDSTNTPIGDAIAGNRYIVIHDRSTLHNVEDLKWYTPVAQTSHSIILKNDLCLPFGYYLPDTLSFPENEKISKASYWDSLSRAFTGSSAMEEHMLQPYDPNDKNQDEYFKATPIDAYNDNVEIYFITPSSGELYINSQFFQYLHEVPEGAEIDFSCIRTKDATYDNLTQINFYLLHRDVLNEMCEKIKENAYAIDDFDNNHVSGHISMPENGTLNFSIPYDKKWRVFVDDKEMTAKPFAQAFLSVDVPKGVHSVSLSYDQSFWTWPMTLTLISWIAFIAACFITDKMNRRNQAD